MIVVRDIQGLQGQPVVATIGFFDGVHRGHRFLIEEMVALARSRNLPSAVITFPVHPRIVLQADYQPKLLNSFEEKLEHLAELDIDYCIVLEFTKELSQLSAYEFITKVLAKQMHVNTLLIGYDHRFGRDRSDGFEEYTEYGAACGMEVVKASSYSNGEVAVSSSEIRRQLLSCQVELAASMLTYPYQLKGSIVNGYKVGRTLGFPTANIQVEEPFKVIPGIGVYGVHVDCGNRQLVGMLYIGNRPTLNNGENITLEVNILDFSGDLYNKELSVSFIHYIRGDVRFESLDALKEQLTKDRETVRRLMIN